MDPLTSSVAFVAAATFMNNLLLGLHSRPAHFETRLVERINHYSRLRVTIGSTRIARRAGMKLASKATAIRKK
jgi:hypothetical protein